MKREREIPEITSAICRQIRALGKRIGDADPVDLTEFHLVTVSADTALRAAVDAQREAGFSWQQIADGLGITRQTAWARFSPTTETDPPTG